MGSDLYVHLVSDKPQSASQREVSPGVVLDYDEHGRPIGVEVIGAVTVEIDGKPVAAPEFMSAEDLFARLSAADLAWGREFGDPPAEQTWLAFLAEQMVKMTPPLAAPAAQPTQAEIRAAILGPNAGDRPRFWWSPSKALIRGGSRDTVPADAVELVPRTAVERPAAQPDDEVARERIAKALWWDAGTQVPDSVRTPWVDATTSMKGVYYRKADVALAALREGQRHG